MPACNSFEYRSFNVRDSRVQPQTPAPELAPTPGNSAATQAAATHELVKAGSLPNCEITGVTMAKARFAESAIRSLTDSAPYQGKLDGGMEKPPHVKKTEKATGTTYELSGMKNHSAEKHETDCVVHLSKGFDPSKPFKVVIYNHGLQHSAGGDFKRYELDKQLASSPQTVVIVPETGAYAQGELAKDNGYKKMFQEAFNNVPELKGKSIDGPEVKGITVIAHSAGSAAAAKQINDNGLLNKVDRIVSLDSLYNGGHQWDRWIDANAKALAANDGSRQLVVLHHDSTAANTRALEDRLKHSMHQQGSDPHCMKSEWTGESPSPDEVKAHAVVMRRVCKMKGGESIHNSMPLWIQLSMAREANPAGDKRS